MIDRALTEEIATIVRAVTIHSATSFSFAGQLVTRADALPAPPFGARRGSNAVVEQLQASLYNHCFTRRFRGELRDGPTADELADDLMPALSAANASRERWDPGWQIGEVFPTGQVLARKASLARSFWPGDFVTHDAAGLPPRVGAMLSVFLRRESTTIQPGFYFAFGETAADPMEDDNLVRFYWNVEAAGAPLLTRLITQALNRFQVPFRLKCLTNRAHYYRIDSAVVFVTKRHYRVTAELLLEVYRDMRGALGDDTPLFAKQLAPGLALAEDPGYGDSFGTSRCRLLAEGLWSAHVRGLESLPDRLQEVGAHFERQGVPFDRPYATGGFVEQYEYPEFTA
jgi:hypothetical protein